jgi:hypothetical protein
VPYPAVYQVFGEKDLGCMPFHGRKFTARLEEAKASADPVHLRCGATPATVSMTGNNRRLGTRNGSPSSWITSA